MEHLKRSSSEQRNKTVIMIFIDGLGLGGPDPAFNPLYRGDSPFLASLFSKCNAIDACQEMPGLPQSATGHTALYTGKNAAQIQGHHLTGFPGPTLKKVIREGNIFSRLHEMGRRCTFANGYFWGEGLDPYLRKYQSVTTVMTLHALNGLREVPEIRTNRAVCQDLTRDWIRKHAYEGERITAQEAAGHLIDIAKDYDFTLFEYFRTDMLAHKGSDEEIATMLSELDAFVATSFELAIKENIGVIITSDHGNLEDLHTRSHTRNPIPYITLGEDMDTASKKITTLMDITPTLLEYFATE